MGQLLSVDSACSALDALRRLVSGMRRRAGSDRPLLLDCSARVDDDLARHGYRLFRGVRAGRCSVGRAALGPKGVFVLLDAMERTNARETVVSDRDDRRWPFRIGHDALGRARRQTKRLSSRLSAAVGQAVAAYPLLSLPGWLANRGGWGDIVIMGKADYEALTTRPAMASPLVVRVGSLLVEWSDTSTALAEDGEDERGACSAGRGSFPEVLAGRGPRPFLVYSTPSAIKGPLPPP